MDSSARSSLPAFLRARVLVPGLVLVAVTAAAGCGSSSGTTSAVSSAAGSDASPTHLQSQYEQVVRNVLPSVVEIETASSTGSGVVYNGNGDIVTNEHVVGDASSVEVLTAAGSPLAATVVGKFAPDDLAVIRVTSDASKLKPAKWANSDDAQIGEIVLAMGNPLGLADSVTQGIISATGRTVGASEETGKALITAAIQTSAAINPGNSGGALVNLSDQVVGIPTLAARLPDAGAAPGIGFAIPSNTVRDIADQLISTGKVTKSDRATLSIAAQTSANSSGVGVGVAVVDVTSGGAADKAGIRAGSLITEVDGVKTPTVQALEGVLATLKPGQKVPVVVVVNGASRTVQVTLDSLTS